MRQIPASFRGSQPSARRTQFDVHSLYIFASTVYVIVWAQIRARTGAAPQWCRVDSGAAPRLRIQRAIRRASSSSRLPLC